MTDQNKGNKNEKVRKPLPRKKELKSTQSMDDRSGGQATKGTADSLTPNNTQWDCSDNC
ncbi:MAG: hypothetical protein K2X77_32540 [Candidatus Obscuribacterales bacterium]|jgi:hypothetical protein|nr:hypothetical protein [Candidatus Obscuribacterales bacterium]